MSSQPDRAASTDSLRDPETLFDERNRERIERAVDEHDFEDLREFVQEATLRLVGELLDEGGRIECPHDDCDRTFATRRKLRGHLGSSEHALNVPDGDFWCGYCGYGPTSWRGVNAHHGASDHDGEVIRLDEEPDRSDLVDPEDVPDHKNPELLERLYKQHDGNYTAMCRDHDFEVTSGRVRHYLIEFGIHEVTPQGEATERGDGPRYRDPEWLEEKYEAADRNVSEMHRQIDIEMPYRTLLKNLKRFDIHDPTESPGRGQANRERNSADETAESTDESDDDVDASETEEGSGDTDSIPYPSLLAVDDLDEVDSYQDLNPPGWMDEHSLYAAADMAHDIDSLADALGWHELDRIEFIVDVLDLELGGDSA